MEPIITISVTMIIIVVAIILFLCHIGCDLRSRGFDGTYALTVLHQNEISIGDYYKKKDQHPVIEGQDKNVKMSKLYFIASMITVLLAILVAFALSTF